VLDLTINEDDSRVRMDQALESISISRHIALNLFKQELTIKAGIKTKRLD